MNNLLSILRCPITKLNLRELKSAEIQLLNKQIKTEKVFHVNGTLVKHAINRGLISKDGKYIYPIINGIIVLYKYLAINNGRKTRLSAKYKLKLESKSVLDFYNQIGWKRNSGDQFNDALKYEDLRTVVHDYVHKCHLRVNNYLKPKGDYLLDAGSGPIQYLEYFTYSKGYKRRVCIDISLLALKEARKRLGNKGIYILGDLTNLPFRDQAFDGEVSMHVIYHIPKDYQKKALLEMYRTLKTNSSAVIVYSWPDNLNILVAVGKLFRKIGILKRQINKPDFYFQPQKIEFLNHGLGFNLNIFVWRSIGVDFTKKYIHDWFFGKSVLSLIYWIENKIPKLIGKVGRYPLIVIKK